MGKIEIDHTGSASGITLSSDGTSLLLDGTAIGGGGGDPDLYRDNAVSATTPTASGDNAVAIGDGSTASAADAISIGGGTASGSSAVALGDYRAIASGNRSLAVGNSLASGASSTALNIGMNSSGYGATNTGAFAAMANTKASGTYSLAMGYGAVASSGHSVGIGYNANSTGYQAVTLGNSYTSGTDSLAAAIANNTSSYGATGSNSVSIGNLSKSTHYSGIALGHQNIVSGNRSASIGGRSNTAGSDMSGIIGGYGNNTSNQYTFIGGGYNNVASGLYSAVIGGYDNDATDQGAYATGMWANSSIKGKWAHGAAGHLGTTTSGSQQSGHYVLISNTTDATAEALTTDNSTAGTSNQIVLPDNSAYAFSGTIVARQKASEGTASAAWKVEGLIRREGSAGTTVLVNSATTVLDNTPNWGMALSADTTNGCLKVAVTGAASTNIRWVSTITTSELIYA